MKEIIQQAKDSLPPNSRLIYLARTGSKLYNTDTEKSDDDYRGIYITHNHTLLVSKPKTSIQINPDFQLMELGHFVDLLSKTSPNTIETLLIKAGDILYQDEAFNDIINNQEKFLTEGYIKTLKYFSLSLWKRNRDNKSIAHSYRIYILVLNILKGVFTSKLTDEQRAKYLELRNYNGVVKDFLPLMEWSLNNIGKWEEEFKLPKNHNKEFYNNLLLKIRLDHGIF